MPPGVETNTVYGVVNAVQVGNGDLFYRTADT